MPSVTEVISGLDLYGLSRVPAEVLEQAGRRGTVVHERIAGLTDGSDLWVDRHGRPAELVDPPRGTESVATARFRLSQRTHLVVARPYLAAWDAWRRAVDMEPLLVEERMLFRPPAVASYADLVVSLTHIVAGKVGGQPARLLPSPAHVAGWWLREGRELIPTWIGGTNDLLAILHGRGDMWAVTDYKTRRPVLADALQLVVYLHGLMQLYADDFDGLAGARCVSVHLSKTGSYRQVIHRDHSRALRTFAAALVAWSYLHRDELQSVIND